MAIPKRNFGEWIIELAKRCIYNSVGVAVRPADGINSDGSQDVVRIFNDAEGIIHAGALSVATTQLAAWPCAQLKTKAICLTLVGHANGSVFTLYARGALSNQGTVYSDATAGTEDVLWTETLANATPVYRYIDISAFPLPTLVLAAKVETNAMGATTEIRTYGKGD